MLKATDCISFSQYADYEHVDLGSQKYEKKYIFLMT